MAVMAIGATLVLSALASDPCWVVSNVPCGNKKVGDGCQYDGRSGIVHEEGTSYSQCVSGSPGNRECDGGTDQSCSYVCKTYYDGEWHINPASQISIKKNPTAHGTSC